MIEDLIDLEMQYFKPMLQRAKEATDEQQGMATGNDS